MIGEEVNKNLLENHDRAAAGGQGRKPLKKEGRSNIVIGNQLVGNTGTNLVNNGTNTDLGHNKT